MKRLGSYIRPYVGYILFTMLIKLIGALVELLIPYLMEIILDDVVPTGQLRPILGYGALMLLCAFGCLAANVIANRMSAVSSGKITLRLRHDLFEKLENLSARQMDALTLPSAESRLTSDTYNFNQLLARVQRLGVRAPILLLGGIAMMLGMDAPLALVMIAMLPIIAVVVWQVTRTSVPLYQKEQSVLDRVVRVLQENITGIRVIKALSKTEYEKGRFHGVNEELSRVDRRAGVVTGITNPTASLVLNLGLTLVVVVGAQRVNAGSCQSGVIIAFLQYFTMILNAMLGVTRIFIMWSKGEASAVRVAEVLELPPDMQVAPAEETERAAETETTAAEGESTAAAAKASETEKPAENTAVPHIEFDHVTFSYTGVGTNLHDLSFTLQPGESLGILGATGSGKSTVLALLLRFYDPQQGAVRINGRDVRTIPHEELRGMFGAAFQNDFVMEGTIADNIRFFRGVDDAALQRASEDAQAAEFIATRDGGMEYPVAVRGNNLSGGQKQRLLIARALAAQPQILLLDDASSALDYRTDAALRKALHRGYADTTTLIVAQRVSSICHCDHILVLADGETIGYGTHEQLLQSCEEYRIIAETQMADGKEMA